MYIHAYIALISSVDIKLWKLCAMFLFIFSPPTLSTFIHLLNLN